MSDDIAIDGQGTKALLGQPDGVTTRATGQIEAVSSNWQQRPMAGEPRAGSFMRGSLSRSPDRQPTLTTTPTES